jgi:signal transduction histidine kinase/ActR/RegA family two-component response regulator
MTELRPELSTRLLVVPPTPRDGEITSSLLSSAGVESVNCRNIDDLLRELESGAGGLILTDQSLSGDAIDRLLAALKAQPPWSDLPILVLMPGAGHSSAARHALAGLGNVTLLERPVAVRSLISAARAAIRARLRQYEARQLIVSEHSARAAAEQAGRMKDEFLATLSHELRTPLNAILGWSQLLMAREYVDAEVTEGLSVIERNAKVQTRLVEDLLDMSRIVAGKLRLDVQTVDIREVIEAAVASVQHSADARGIRVQKVLDPTVGPVRGDPGRLQQCFWNLLSNAIKFTPRGGTVQVTLERVKSHIEACVIDSGVGIEPDFLPYIFERFRQADSSSKRMYGGLGLGLSIVKHLLELHGGTVRAKSGGEGLGAAFCVELPLMVVRTAERDSGCDGPEDTAPMRAMDCPRLDGIKVLAVDDEPDARQLIKRVLEECGAEVVLASSAGEALECVVNGRPDMILSDIGMPGEDGYEFIRKVRALPPDAGGRTPAAALTAFARSEDRTRALLAGYQTHVAKPVEAPELVAVVASLATKT